MAWVDEKLFPAIRKDLSTVAIIALSATVVFLYKAKEEADNKLNLEKDKRAEREEKINNVLIGVTNTQASVLQSVTQLNQHEKRVNYSGIDSNAAGVYR